MELQPIRCHHICELRHLRDSSSPSPCLVLHSRFLPVLLRLQRDQHGDRKASWSVADAVDYKGLPADKSKTGGWVPAALILGLSSTS
ncbi:hypothetical protein B296_00003150 [Ensete ventricosum]|uniref:Uncharacterized protein n=1 Tax=Ensete ventricosum TaxID=4639 RepID=A0A427AYX3_ENSVE|nr:hypothetical protein B296_00003150 [Ensete ventricosum]